MKQINKKGIKNKIGAYGEIIAKNYLIKKGFKIIEVNYAKKWGEIDIVSYFNKKIIFIEVKTVSYETKNKLFMTLSDNCWRPEENVTYKKIKRLHRTINSWLTENNYSGLWQLDVIAVRIVTREKYATVKHIDNIIA